MKKEKKEGNYQITLIFCQITINHYITQFMHYIWVEYEILPTFREEILPKFRTAKFVYNLLKSRGFNLMCSIE
jgi:hypothetical protein